jgi:hypothetical protein
VIFIRKYMAVGRAMHVVGNVWLKRGCKSESLIRISFPIYGRLMRYGSMRVTEWNM